MAVIKKRTTGYLQRIIYDIEAGASLTEVFDALDELHGGRWSLHSVRYMPDESQVWWRRLLHIPKEHLACVTISLVSGISRCLD